MVGGGGGGGGGSICRVLGGSEALGSSSVFVLRVGEGGARSVVFYEGLGSICLVLGWFEALGGSFVRVLRVGEALGGHNV